jgi:hypothetical protein
MKWEPIDKLSVVTGDVLLSCDKGFFLTTVEGRNRTPFDHILEIGKFTHWMKLEKPRGR